MNAYEFLTEKNNGKTPDQMVKDGEFLGAIWVVSMLEEYAELKAKTCNKQHVSKSGDVERGHSVCCTKCGKSLKPIYMCTDCIDVEMQKKLKQTDC